MRNVKIEIAGDEMVIRVKLSERFGRSKSGSSEIIASTGGNVSVPGHPEIKLGLNCYK